MGLFPATTISNPSGLPQGPLSNVYFVDYNNGNDSNPGNKREQPLESITAAIAKCGDAQGDTIFVTSPVHVEATLPIVVNKQGVSIYGLPGHEPGQQPGTWIWPISDNPVFTLSAGDVKIYNFLLWGGASGPCINFGAGATNVRIGIHNCSFHQGTHGVRAGPALLSPSHYLSITDCHFGPTLSVGGISLESNGSWPIIARNFFDSIAMPNVYCTLPGVGGRCYDNVFMLPADTTVGGAIHLENAGRWSVYRNYANDSTVAAITNNPYRDVLQANAWYDNVIGGGAVTAPSA